MNWRKAAAGFTAAILSVTTASIFPPKTVSAADVCVIDTDTEYQTIRGFGGINHPEWAGDLTQAQRQTAFGNGENELGLTVLRESGQQPVEQSTPHSTVCDANGCHCFCISVGTAGESNGIRRKQRQTASAQIQLCCLCKASE